jgi:hypothetical protein
MFHPRARWSEPRVRKQSLSISNVHPGRASRKRADWDRRTASRSRTEPAYPPGLSDVAADGAGFWRERGAAAGGRDAAAVAATVYPFWGDGEAARRYVGCSSEKTSS